jgi:uncharacterized RDD family membrane protein YckC
MAEVGRWRMNQIACPVCQRTLTFADEQPSFCSHCGAKLAGGAGQSTAAYEAAEPATLPPVPRGDRIEDPETIGGYRLLRRLGAGGMGSVYEAEETASGRHVAVKVVGAEIATSADAIERFRQEGRLASAIAHPRCVFVLAADEEAGRPYIVMELVTGKTLRDLVDERGPLPVDEAVTKILDVIDGLIEAHRLGVIHRDVKPSNCFVEKDGRVKIGDFGLAKSLETDSQLTRTGAFLGTPLYASPEQIRKDPLDERTDVYSVAATLYYLLTGRAPFESGDAAATMARIVSDPAPSMEGLRRGIPPGLDAAVRRGLERHRDRRWRNLDEFRDTLLPFVPRTLPAAGVGLRVGAYILDYLPFWLLIKIAGGIVLLTMGLPRSDRIVPFLVVVLVTTLLIKLAMYAYFIAGDGRWGHTIAKRLLHLRVVRGAGSEEPGLAKGLLRAAAFFGVLEIIPMALSLGILFYTGIPQEFIATGTAHRAVRDIDLPFGNIDCFNLLGLAILMSTMRRRNGFRMLHDFASDTRVVRLPWPERRRSLACTHTRLVYSPAEGLPGHLGRFEIAGAIDRLGESQLLAGADHNLKRPVWIRLCQQGIPRLDNARRDLTSSVRPRWLTSGTDGDRQWDVFLALPGQKLVLVIKEVGPLTWAEARPMIQVLADELSDACRTKTLPSVLREDQIWVQPSGQLHWWDIPTSQDGKSAIDSSRDEERAGSFLGRVAALILEGRLRSGDGEARPLAAPIPEHAAAMINRLLTSPAATATEIAEELRTTADRPTEVSASWRAASLMILAATMFFPFLFMYAAPVLARTVFVVAKHFELGRKVDAAELSRAANESWLQFALADVGQSPGVALANLAIPLADEDLRSRAMHLARHESAAASLDESAGFLARCCIGAIEKNPDRFMPGDYKRESAILDARFNSRARLERLVAEEDDTIGDFNVLPRIVVPAVMVFPALCVLSAFIFRGGVILQLMGMVLLRANGRRALRIQCAWRALLTWVPPTALLLLAVWLDIRCWNVWAATGHPGKWYEAAAWASWFAALLLLPTYLLLALWYPARGPQDRLSGTYLLPR